IIVAAPLTAVAAMAKAVPNVPIVIAAGTDPVVAGLAQSLARPGGMITGITNLGIDLTEKYLELLLQAAPKLRRVGFLIDPRMQNYSSRIEAVRRSVAQQAVEARFVEAARPEEIEPAISRLASEGAQAL